MQEEASLFKIEISGGIGEMIYSKTDQQVEIILTKECNWFCKHCLYGINRYKNKLTSEIIDKHIPYIFDMISRLEKTNICLVGGEIGLVDKKFLDIVFKYVKDFNFQVTISTNGTYLKKYSDSYQDLINYIFCHLPDEPDNELLKYKNACFGKVFNEFNEEEIKKFIIFYKNFNIDYLGFDFPLSKTVSEVYIKHCYSNLLKLCDKYSNISESCKRDIENKLKLIPELKKTRFVCSQLNQTISIDLEDERIVQCSGRSNNSVELNEKNLKTIFSLHKPLFGNNKYCSSCFPWCIEKDFMNTVRIKLRNIKTI